jgi:hypothetical protein
MCQGINIDVGNMRKNGSGKGLGLWCLTPLSTREESFLRSSVMHHQSSVDSTGTSSESD